MESVWVKISCLLFIIAVSTAGIIQCQNHCSLVSYFSFSDTITVSFSWYSEHSGFVILFSVSRLLAFASSFGIHQSELKIYIFLKRPVIINFFLTVMAWQKCQNLHILKIMVAVFIPVVPGGRPRILSVAVLVQMFFLYVFVFLNLDNWELAVHDNIIWLNYCCFFLPRIRKCGNCTAYTSLRTFVWPLHFIYLLFIGYHADSVWGALNLCWFVWVIFLFKH